MHILPVQNKKDLRKFINFPFTFYKEDPNCVAPLRFDLRNQFNPDTNPMLSHCDYQLFLLVRDKQIIGRIAAFIDHLAVDFWEEKIGLFGYYECLDESEAFQLLLIAAVDWLKEQGIRRSWTCQIPALSITGGIPR